MLNWYEVLAQEERNRDLLREAEKHRLVRQALAGRKARADIHCRALSWLGRHLVGWGCALQARYSIPVEAPSAPATNHCQ